MHKQSALALESVKITAQPKGYGNGLNQSIRKQIEYVVRVALQCLVPMT